MKIVIAMDSFKGSLTSMEAGNAVAQAARESIPGAEVLVKPLADGGEGTTLALMEGLSGTKINLTVSGPLGLPVDAYYGAIPRTKTAVMEMATAAGITLVEGAAKPQTGDGRTATNGDDTAASAQTVKDPLRATTYGVGQMILHAAEAGYRNFVMGIGGSATNDGGVGMLQALGFSFLDAQGQEVPKGAQCLGSIAEIRREHVPEVLKECTFQIACDVTNPLCGPTGATYVFGPQKGVTPEQLAPLDQAMAHYAEVANKTFGTDFTTAPGAGAAGGMGFAFLTFLGADLVSGSALINQVTGLSEELKDADLVVTGEGRIDRQTAMGKGPMEVAKEAKKAGSTVIGLAGSLGEGAEVCNEQGMDVLFSITPGPMTMDEAMKPEVARKNLYRTAKQALRLAVR